MKELNTTVSLWRRDGRQQQRALAAECADGATTALDGVQGVSVPPVCCWNLCSGIFTPTSKVRTRRKPIGAGS